MNKDEAIKYFLEYCEDPENKEDRLRAIKFQYQIDVYQVTIYNEDITKSFGIRAKFNSAKSTMRIIYYDDTHKIIDITNEEFEKLKSAYIKGFEDQEKIYF